MGLTTALVIGLASLGQERPDPAPRGVAPSSDVPRAGGSGSLLIEDLEIIDAFDGNSEVRARAVATWSGTEFPGVRSCTFVARGANGEEVGRLEDIVVTLQPVAPFSLKIAAESAASSVDAECGPRLDVGTPYRYDISNVQVTGEKTAAVKFDASWMGPGQAGAVQCWLEVFDGSGSVVGAEEFNLFILTGFKSELDRVIDVDGQPVRAELDCSPFTS
jgi:hypothetical protein